MPEVTPPEGGEQFAPITSQDDLNRIVGERLARERAKYADYDAIKAKAAEFDKAAEASKTEMQKVIDRAEAAEKRAAALEADRERASWADEITKGSTIPAAVLRGSTREELQAHFDQLKTLVAPEKPKRTPVPAGKPANDGDKPASRAVAALREMRGTA